MVILLYSSQKLLNLRSHLCSENSLEISSSVSDCPKSEMRWWFTTCAVGKPCQKFPGHDPINRNEVRVGIDDPNGSLPTRELYELKD